MSTATPYVPFDRPKVASEAEIQRMLARMKEGPRAAAPPPPVTADDRRSPPLSAIDWDKPVRRADGTGYCLSKCGGWSVTKVSVAGQFKYQAWRIRQEWKFCLGTKDTFDGAKALCKPS